LIVESCSIFKSLERVSCENRFPLFATRSSNNIEKHYPDFAADHPELPLSFAYQMRNALAHGYFQVDFEIVWTTIHSDISSLHAVIAELRKDLNRTT